MNVIDGIYRIIPLLFLFVFPGSMLPIAISIALLSAYLPSIGNGELPEFIQGCIELVSLSILASLMVYFQKKTINQMRSFRRESYTDYLTGLNNRKSFIKHLDQQKLKIDSVRYSNLNFALLVVDLDGFKKINDQLGHASGDNVLKLIALRFKSLTNKSIELYRISGDEFTFILTPQHNIRKKAELIAEQVLKISQQPHVFEGKSFELSCSIGISIYPEDTTDIEVLCTHADLAMYKAKSNGKKSYVFYEDKLAAQSNRFHDLEADLKKAIKRQELTVHYQPKVCVITGKITSAEALLRWQHPKYGAISPLEFIAIAEANDTICDIGAWVFKQACQNIKLFKEISPLRNIAVNVSPKQLAQETFVKQLDVILKEQQCPAHWIEIEQTESALMESREKNISVLNQLKAAGFTLSLDDFGTVYSSLAQLSSLPIQIIKIDKRFIEHCATKHKDRMIVRAIIQLADNLGMETIAEGVETPEQLSVLRQEHCGAYQGYLYSKPVPATQFIELLLAQEHRTRLPSNTELKVV